ncbi:hypothetical protein P171DRAFT_426956 [Karstenula rhodostoma CBS 690.94]|uniref:Cytochrome P450 n=1 Tax=Karstenula rhodostoma CBS 690.94 TaxID=1392251 RepID=A0A9P4PXD0_9PLEO|nr:hypothetical protein P171DRAFT_426956 [Karstenula rhodostoma CBS 690.94]
MEVINLPQSAGAAALLGVLFHFVVCQIEFELVMFHFMVAFVLGALGLVYAVGFLGAAVIVTSFNTALLGSIGIYRLLFHRLRKFPGPVGAKITKFHATRLAAKDVQYYKELAKMHEKYGDIVRTGPRELSVLRPTAVSVLYGPNSETRKSTWYGQTGNDPKKCSIHMTRNFEQHRARRRAWDRGFSIKALGTYEPRIKAKADLFMKQIAKSTAEPMDILIRRVQLPWEESCAGELAIAQNLDVAFAPGETGEAFEKEFLDTFTVTLPPLQLVFTPRNVS